MPRGNAGSDADSMLRDTLLRMHETAQAFFQERLPANAGARAREYLRSRGLSKETAAQFGIGYAPGGNALLGLLRKKGFREEALEASGLVGKAEDRPDFYDRFRERLTFPIHNETGRVIAFGGRAMQAERQPKYLNSPETAIYKKNAVLYNLGRARAAMRQENRVVLVEGYMDVIGVCKAGVANAVATCGTALTPQQVRALRRHVDTVTVNFDSDEARPERSRALHRDAAARGRQRARARIARRQRPRRFLRGPRRRGVQETTRTRAAPLHLVDRPDAPAVRHGHVRRARRRFRAHAADDQSAAGRYPPSSGRIRVGRSAGRRAQLGPGNVCGAPATGAALRLPRAATPTVSRPPSACCCIFSPARPKRAARCSAMPWRSQPKTEWPAGKRWRRWPPFTKTRRIPVLGGRRAARRTRPRPPGEARLRQRTALLPHSTKARKHSKRCGVKTGSAATAPCATPSPKRNSRATAPPRSNCCATRSTSNASSACPPPRGGSAGGRLRRDPETSFCIFSRNLLKSIWFFLVIYFDAL